MAGTDMPQQGADLVVFKAKQSRSPPAATVGVVGWLRENLFYSWFSTIVTVLVSYVLVTTFMSIWEWGVTKAVWDAKTRRECLDQVGAHGACWAGIKTWFWSFIYGRYPIEERWRVDLGFYLVVLWLLPLWLPRVTHKIGVAATAVVFYPFLAGYLFYGGERGLFMQFMVCMAVVVFAMVWLNVILSMATGDGLKEWIVRMTGFGARHESQHKWPLLGFVVIAYLVVYFLLGGWTEEIVKTHLWGGLFVTLLIAGCAIVSALPGGIVLALARRSTMPIIKVFAIAYIELFRSVPLISVLFMAVTMFPLFLPEGAQLDKLVQAIIGVCMFAAAYMAEVVRGGLQAIPKGQYEAAEAMGLTYWKSMNLIILPQALKLMIPNIVGNFLGLLKDTTLVSIIGLYDMLLMLRAAGQNPKWIGLHHETLFFGATVYFILCYVMSQYSQHLERKFATGHKS